MAEQNKPRGFATLSIERRKEIASMGGKAAHRSGNAHQYTSEQARAAAKRRHELAAAAARQARRDAGGRVPMDDEAYEGLDQL